MNTIIDYMPARDEVIRRGDDRMAAYNHDTMMTGDPDAVVRPRDVQECADILAYCHGHALPVTFCAGHTSMTGSSVAESGVVVSIEKLRGIHDIGRQHGRPFARVAPGMFLGEFQRAVDAEGYYYPPSPTSRHEAMIGATVATNATGDNTYKYGTTRKYIRALQLLMADGTTRTITRPAGEQVTELKNMAGYYLQGSPIDHFIGSEGTLGLITEVTVDLLERPQPHFGLFVFFPTREAALETIVRADADGRVSPSALEYIDHGALQIMATHESFPPLPEGVGAALIIYQEYAEESYDALLNNWFALLTNADPSMARLLDHAIVSTQPSDEARLRTWRHHIPAAVNEEGHRLEAHGGGKVGSDWWVPLARMPAMMQYMYERSDALGIPYVAFGHLGNGHPHVNYLTRNPEEKTRAKQLVIDCCRKAVSLGGGVAGEHGLGKLKRDLLTIQHPQTVIDQMIALKQSYDPHWILGRGNILTPASLS